MPQTEPQESTAELRANFDDFVRDFEEEIERQTTKTNLSSERRMRGLLRDFRERVYVPYRDATLSREEDNEPQEEEQVPF